ncbi:MAG: TolC family protein [bacterium]|nr:TolC family protein [bacterium]
MIFTQRESELIRRNRPRLVTALLLIVVLFPRGSSGQTVLTVEQAIEQAIGHNRAYLASQQEIEKAKSEVAQARSGALPQISFNADYSRSFIIPKFFLTEGSETMEFQLGFKNNWNAAISLNQPLWQGGKVFAALDIAKTYKKYTEAVADQAKADVAYGAEMRFHSVVLARSELEVVRAAYAAAIENLAVVESLFEKGLVPKYDLLRARVDKANLEPNLLAAESGLKLAEKELKSFLGINLAEPITVTAEKVIATETVAGSLDSLTRAALEGRPEMHQVGYNTEMRKRAIRVAKGGYFPSLNAFSTYSWQSQSDAFSLKENNSRSMTAGLTLSIPIFNGGRTRGEVASRKADYVQARLTARDMEDQVKLQVEQAYDLMVQARKSIETVVGTVAEAEEADRIARLRFESGMGTQLEVLSAQAALTQARNSQAVAEYNYNMARAGLSRAVGQ